MFYRLTLYMYSAKHYLTCWINGGTIYFIIAAAITNQCNECHSDAGDAGDDMAKCNSELTTQNCTSPLTDSFYTLVTRYQFHYAPETTHTGVLRGCVYCPSKKNPKFHYHFLSTLYWRVIWRKHHLGKTVNFNLLVKLSCQNLRECLCLISNLMYARYPLRLFVTWNFHWI